MKELLVSLRVVYNLKTYLKFTLESCQDYNRLKVWRNQAGNIYAIFAYECGHALRYIHIVTVILIHVLSVKSASPWNPHTLLHATSTVDSFLCTATYKYRAFLNTCRHISISTWHIDYVIIYIHSPLTSQDFVSFPCAVHSFCSSRLCQFSPAYNSKEDHRAGVVSEFHEVACRRDDP